MGEVSFTSAQDFLLGAHATLSRIGGFHGNGAEEIAPVAQASALVGIGLELRRIADALTGNAGDAYVIVRGGLVVNEPALPVLDLDCLDDRTPTRGTYDEVVERAGQARELGLTEVAAECDEWLAVHPTLRPEA